MAENTNPYGIPVQEVVTTRDDNVFGRRKTFAGLQRSEWAFVVISVVNILLVLSLTIYRLSVIVQKGQTDQADFTFALLLILNSLFCLAYVVNGILREREFEIYALIAAILVVVVYCIIEYSVNNDPQTGRTIIKLVRMILAIVLAPVNIALALYVAREFGWLEFKIVGASEALQLMYRDASRFSSLLKFDLQVTLSIVLLVLRNGADLNVLEKVVLGVGVPFALIWPIIGWLSVRHEKKWSTGIFMLLGIVVPGYIIFKIYGVYVNLATANKEKHLTESEKAILYSTLAASALGLLVRCILFVELWRCLKNFGKGLKERAFDAEANERTSLLSRPRRR